MWRGDSPEEGESPRGAYTCDGVSRRPKHVHGDKRATLTERPRPRLYIRARAQITVQFVPRVFRGFVELYILSQA